MRRTLLRSKIHRATVTGADLHYVGSMTVDPILLDAAGLVPHEKVEIYNVTNGERLSTYVIEGERGEGEIILNGAAAHKASPGDIVIICNYAELEAHEIADHKPAVIFVDEHNAIVDQQDAVLRSDRPRPLAAVG